MSQPTIGILVAMAQECRSLTSKPIPAGGCLALDSGLIVGLAGAGPAAATRNAALLIEQGATALLSWGCAAALDPALKPGDLVVPASIIGTDGQTLETDPAWRECLISQFTAPIPAYQGKLLESRRIVSSASEKQTLFANTGAIALDMESAAAARAAQAAALPFLAVRSIVDPADVDIPPSIAAAFDENGMLHVGRMLARALLRPADFAAIIRLGRHFDAAMKTLKYMAAIARENRLAA